MATISAVDKGRKNYFDLFNLPIGFEVDPVHLVERYRTLLDTRTVTAFPMALATNLSASDPTPIDIEAGYRTLADPLARAAYLIDLLDAQPGASEGSGGPGGLMMAQMELRESLAEATTGGNRSACVATVLTELAQQGAFLEKDLRRLLSDPSPRNLSAARDTLRRLELLSSCRRDAEHRRTALALEP